MWGQHGHKNVRGLDKNGCHAGFDHVPMVPSPERNVALHSPKTVVGLEDPLALGGDSHLSILIQIWKQCKLATSSRVYQRQDATYLNVNAGLGRGVINAKTAAKEGQDDQRRD